MKHMTLEELVSYADPSLAESDRRKVAAHFSSCPQCRKRFISLQTFKNAVSQIPAPLEDLVLTADCVPTELMGDFLGRRLQEKEQETFSAHVATCEICFERAAFMTSETVKMTEGVLAMRPTPDHFKNAVLPERKSVAVKKKKISFIDAASRWFTSPIPAYAFAAVLLLFLVIGKTGPDGGFINLAQDSSFSFYEQPAQSGPSFGFSDAGRKVGEKPADLDMEKTAGGDLLFSWEAIEEVATYYFTLFKITASGPLEVYEASVEDNEVIVPMKSITDKTAYRWKVSGITDKNILFSATGHFATTDY